MTREFSFCSSNRTHANRKDTGTAQTAAGLLTESIVEMVTFLAI